MKWVLQHYTVTHEVMISGVFNMNVCPLPGVCVLLGSVTELTVSVCSFYTPSTQLPKPPFTAAKPTLTVCVHGVRA